MDIRRANPYERDDVGKGKQGEGQRVKELDVEVDARYLQGLIS